MKVILILIAQPVKIPHFKSLLTRKQARWLHCFVHVFKYWMLITMSLKNKIHSITILRELPKGITSGAMLDVTIHTGHRTILIDEEKLCFVTDFKVSTSKKTTLKQEVYGTSW